ncbi:putative RNA methyltransferase [Thauera sp.]|uniref:putative RNA methyltransferase n=1 Tax=Thauera sp. TaxID=1905334 RepID=UPI002A36C852|nr:methyltransferase domain-containing protein [Thauera sp.]MDX9884612.1 methyltransferase domain-containing protein [Thauera sp.]
MSVSPFTALACPLDGAPLQRSGASWRCADGHCFDIAAQGYVNLLPVQNKRSLDPGDSKDMVAARRRFLEAGHYQPIADAVAQALLQAAPAARTLTCLDAGCGEGYYLRQLAATAGDAHPLALLGLDISKWAVQAAAKRDGQDARGTPRAAWVVGSNAGLPVLPGTLDRVLCMFGFPVYPEFARVLRRGGELLQVDAGPEHLRELREVIYPTLKPERPAARQAPPGFAHLGTDTLRFQIHVDGAAPIADLLAMTPHLYRATAEGRARAAALTALTMTVDVRLARYARHAP